MRNIQEQHVSFKTIDYNNLKEHATLGWSLNHYQRLRNVMGILPEPDFNGQHDLLLLMDIICNYCWISGLSIIMTHLSLHFPAISVGQNVIVFFLYLPLPVLRLENSTNCTKKFSKSILLLKYQSNYVPAVWFTYLVICWLPLRNLYEGSWQTCTIKDEDQSKPFSLHDKGPSESSDDKNSSLNILFQN